MEIFTLKIGKMRTRKTPNTDNFYVKKSFSYITKFWLQLKLKQVQQQQHQFFLCISHQETSLSFFISLIKVQLVEIIDLCLFTSAKAILDLLK